MNSNKAKIAQRTPFGIPANFSTVTHWAIFIFASTDARGGYMIQGTSKEAIELKEYLVEHCGASPNIIITDDACKTVYGEENND